MMTEEVIIKKLWIEKIGQLVQFQIQLPKDAKRIIGFEYGLSGSYGIPLQNARMMVAFVNPLGDPSFAVPSNKPIGRLSLQSAGAENCFLQMDLVENRNKKLHEQVAVALWEPQLWTHAGKKEELSLSVGTNGMVEGFFKNQYGIDEYYSLTYNLLLYLWIEKCKP